MSHDFPDPNDPMTLFTPSTPGYTAIKRVLGADVEILEGYGPCRLDEVIYLPCDTAATLLTQGPRFELAHTIS